MLPANRTSLSHHPEQRNTKCQDTRDPIRLRVVAAPHSRRERTLDVRTLPWSRCGHTSHRYPLRYGYRCASMRLEDMHPPQDGRATSVAPPRQRPCHANALVTSAPPGSCQYGLKQFHTRKRPPFSSQFRGAAQRGCPIGAMSRSRDPMNQMDGLVIIRRCRRLSQVKAFVV